MPQLDIPDEYRESFMRAYNTFLYQLVFDPMERKLVPIHQYPPELDCNDLSYAGPKLSDDLAYQLALGNICLDTHKRIGNYDPEKAKVLVFLLLIPYVRVQSY